MAVYEEVKGFTTEDTGEDRGVYKLRSVWRNTLAWRGLFEAKAAATSLNDGAFGRRLNKFEAVTESVSLANHGINLDRAVGEGKLQLHKFAYGDFDF